MKRTSAFILNLFLSATLAVLADEATTEPAKLTTDNNPGAAQTELIRQQIADMRALNGAFTLTIVRSGVAGAGRSIDLSQGAVQLAADVDGSGQLAISFAVMGQPEPDKALANAGIAVPAGLRLDGADPNLGLRYSIPPGKLDDQQIATVIQAFFTKLCGIAPDDKLQFKLEMQ